MCHPGTLLRKVTREEDFVETEIDSMGNKTKTTISREVEALTMRYPKGKERRPSPVAENEDEGENDDHTHNSTVTTFFFDALEKAGRSAVERENQGRGKTTAVKVG